MTAVETDWAAYTMLSGVLADRPATPSIPAGSLVVYQATDTDNCYIWSGAHWAEAYFGAIPAGALALTNTHILVGNGSNIATDVAMSGDATLANTGAITVTKTGGVAFGPFATGTSAVNLSGVVASAQIAGSYTGITGVGTITAGTWNGTTIDVPHGGTGQTTLTLHGVLVGNGTAGITQLAVGATGEFLIAAPAADPAFGKSISYAPAAFPAGATNTWTWTNGVATPGDAGGTSNTTAFRMVTTVSGAVNFAGAVACFASAINGGSGTGTSAQGFLADVRSSGGGTITTASALQTSVRSQNASSVITDGRHLNVLAPTISGGGTIGTLYGLKMASQINAGVTTAWQLALDGASDNSYIAGTLAVGRTTAAARNLHAEIADAVTAAVSFAERITHSTSGAAAASFGVGTEHEIENASGTNRVAGSIATRWIDATNTTEVSEVVIQTMDAGTLADKVRVTGKGYVISPGNTRVAADVATASAVLADITGLSVNVRAGKTYALEARLYLSGAAALVPNFAIAGTATATDIRMNNRLFAEDGSGSVNSVKTTTALATSTGFVGTISGASYVEITGTITVNAGGTLTVQHKTSTSTLTTKRGSTFIVTEID